MQFFVILLNSFLNNENISRTAVRDKKINLHTLATGALGARRRRHSRASIASKEGAAAHMDVVGGRMRVTVHPDS